MSVLAHKCPSKVPEFMAYQSFIIRLSVIRIMKGMVGWHIMIGPSDIRLLMKKAWIGRSLITHSTSSAWQAMPERVWYAGLA